MMSTKQRLYAMSAELIEFAIQSAEYENSIKVLNAIKALDLKCHYIGKDGPLLNIPGPCVCLPCHIKDIFKTGNEELMNQ